MTKTQPDAGVHTPKKALQHQQQASYPEPVRLLPFACCPPVAADGVEKTIRHIGRQTCCGGCYCLGHVSTAGSDACVVWQCLIWSQHLGLCRQVESNAVEHRIADCQA